MGATPRELSLCSAAGPTAPRFSRALRRRRRRTPGCQGCLLAHFHVTPHLESFADSQNPPDLLRRVFQHEKTVSALSQSLTKAPKGESRSLAGAN